MKTMIICYQQLVPADIMNASLNPEESGTGSAFPSSSDSIWSEINCKLNGTVFAINSKSEIFPGSVSVERENSELTDFDDTRLDLSRKILIP